MDQNNISILGCGWLGLPLAEFLMSKNYHIKGSARSEEKLKILEEKSIESFLIDLPASLDSDKMESFLNSDILIINIPPRSINFQNKIFTHDEIINQFNKIIEESAVKNLIYISSTSVYENTNNLVTEEGPFAKTETAKILLNSESVLLDNSSVNTTILRFGGLYGYGRIPIRKNNDKVILGNQRKLNLLHRNNACEVIFSIIQKNLWNNIYNVCEDEHPTQLEFFHQSAYSSEIENYKIDDSPKEYKIVSNYKLRNALGISLPNKISHT